MNDDNPHLLLAAAGHALWCRAMREVGWEYGPAFDERNRLHDSLVPFESLSPRDQRQVVQAVRALDIENALARAIRHDRGPEREFDVSEMQSGLPVRTASSVRRGDSDQREPRTGIVESWETDRDSWLTVIRVRWSDGSRSEHHPAERELARLSKLFRLRFPDRAPRCAP